MLLPIAKEGLQDQLILSLFVILFLTVVFLGMQYLVYSLRDNSHLQNKQAISRLLKKTKRTDEYDRYLNLTTLEYYPYAPEDHFFFLFEVIGIPVEYEVSRELYDEAADIQFLFINYAVTHLSKKIKIRKVQLMHFSECLE